MKIIIAPDSFKGSLNAGKVAECIAAGFIKTDPAVECYKIPLADGGEGTTHCVIGVIGGRLLVRTVTGPLGEPVQAEIGICKDNKTAVIEVAGASGLTLVPPERRNPLQTTSKGTGELILAALDEGCNKIILGLGGSATNDGGFGILKALGVRFFDREGLELEDKVRDLARLDKIDLGSLDKRLQNVQFTLACDVDNPLCGSQGASAVYGPQKGAAREQVEELDNLLGHYADVLEAVAGYRVREVPGSGAAGGIAAGMLTMFNARIVSGVEIVLELMAVEGLLAKGEIDLLITGEGEINGQSVRGKVPVGVARLAKKYGIPVIAFTGCIGPGSEKVYGQGIEAIIPIAPGPISLSESMSQVEIFLEETAVRVSKLLRIGSKIKD
ncbi:MAG: glycerate kinase [Desulfitobacteriaceae bacterium]|nr:glycerate kinase [Desulfitobacteriaceae bacterium]MDD4346697.1 glycerate kinase [Desulfitobacteriaceae bacterium]MDD4401206.1 glycerate kinase [Desulfitobacteriaceae bacterium]